MRAIDRIIEMNKTGGVAGTLFNRMIGVNPNIMIGSRGKAVRTAIKELDRDVRVLRDSGYTIPDEKITALRNTLFNEARNPGNYHRKNVMVQDSTSPVMLSKSREPSEFDNLVALRLPAGPGKNPPLLSREGLLNVKNTVLDELVPSSKLRSGQLMENTEGIIPRTRYKIPAFSKVEADFPYVFKAKNEFPNAEFKFASAMDIVMQYGEELKIGKTADIVLDIDKGDTLLSGRFKNSPMVVEEFGTDENGQPTVNDKKLLAMRIKKQMPERKAGEQDLSIPEGAEHNGQKGVNLGIKPVDQKYSYDCGAAALAAVLNSMGDNVSTEDLYTKGDKVRDNGLSFSDMCRAAESRGYTCIQGRITAGHLKKLLDKGIPVITGVQDHTSDGTYKDNDDRHYTVVSGYNGEGFVITDSASPYIKTVPYDIFSGRWKIIDDNGEEIRNWGMAVVRRKKDGPVNKEFSKTDIRKENAMRRMTAEQVNNALRKAAELKNIVEGLDRKTAGEKTELMKHLLKYFVLPSAALTLGVNSLANAVGTGTHYQPSIQDLDDMLSDIRKPGSDIEPDKLKQEDPYYNGTENKDQLLEYEDPYYNNQENGEDLFYEDLYKQMQEDMGTKEVRASALDIIRRTHVSDGGTARKSAGKYPVMVRPDADGWYDEEALLDAKNKSYAPVEGLPADFFMDNVTDYDNVDAAIQHYMDNEPAAMEYSDTVNRRKKGEMRAIDMFVRKEAIKLDPKLFAEGVYAKLLKNPEKAPAIAETVARIQNRQVGNHFRVGGFKNRQANSYSNADAAAETLYGSANRTGIDLTKYLKERQGVGGLPWQGLKP